MDEQDKITNIAEANEAERIMNSPVLRKAFENMERSFVEGLKNTDFGDDARRDRLHSMLVLLGQLESHLRATIGKGKVVAFEIEQEKRTFLGDIWPRTSNR